MQVLSATCFWYNLFFKQKTGRTCSCRFSSVFLVAAGSHDLQNDPVGLLHALLGQNTNVGNGVVNTLCDDAVTAAELLIVAVHLVTQNAGVHTGCDLGRTGRLCTVTDGTAEDCNRIDNGMGDGMIAAVQQIGNTRACTDTGADSAAVSRQAANATKPYKP